MPRPTPDPRSLQQRIDAYVDRSPSTLGIVIHDPRQGPLAAHLPTDRFPLGSLYKLFVMAGAFELARDGALGLDEALRTIDEYPFGEPAGGVPPATTLSVLGAIQAMIAVSSNAAALALIHRLGADAVMRVPARLGLPGLEIGIARGETSGHYRIDAVGSALDLSRFFIAIDGEALLGPTFDRRMIDVLLNQTIVDRLPAHLPRPVPVAHKTADLDGYTHDAGLVYLPGHPYAIAALALGDSPIAGKVAIADLSRIAFDYFSAPN